MVVFLGYLSLTLCVIGCILMLFSFIIYAINRKNIIICWSYTEAVI